MSLFSRSYHYPEKSAFKGIVIQQRNMDFACFDICYDSIRYHSKIGLSISKKLILFVLQVFLSVLA